MSAAATARRVLDPHVEDASASAPHSVEAEQSALACVLLDNAAFAAVDAALSVGDFYRHDHRLIYAAICRIVGAGQVADPITVHARLQAEGRAEQAGGLRYITAVAESLPSARNAAQYAQIVADRARRRDLIAAADELRHAASDPQGRDVGAIAAGAVRRIERAAAGSVGQAGADGVRIVAADQFLRALRIPQPVIDGILPRGQVYSFTGPTGHAKTAIAATMQVCIATGRPFAGRQVEAGRVLVLAGENPDDYALRLLATAQAVRVPPAALSPIGVIPGAFGLAAAIDRLGAEVERFGDVAAVFVDTSAAFFDGDDENANPAMRAHASRLRMLCDLPGRPVVIVLCHPTKNATRENLLPRGGGAFLAEVDGNLTSWRDGCVATLHWGGKLRGPGFEPIAMELVPQTLAIVDARGRAVASVAAVPASEQRLESIADAALTDENRMLAAMASLPGGSVADLATAAGFVAQSGAAQKSRAYRLLERLAADGLAAKSRHGRWRLTKKGQAEAAEDGP
ncbi:MAG: DnaB-like helicase N-terminal domain-containing protein [Pseudomonadota bacterium]